MAEEEIALPEDEEEILAEPNEYSTEYGSVSGQGISLANSEGTWSKGSLSQIKSEMKKKTFYMGVLLSLVFTFSFFVFLPFGDRFFLYTLTNATAVVCFLMLVVFGISPFFYCEGFFLPMGIGYGFVGLNLIFARGASTGSLTGVADTNVFIQFNTVGRVFELISLFVGILLVQKRFRGWAPLFITLFIGFVVQALFVASIINWKSFSLMQDASGNKTLIRNVVENLTFCLFIVLLALIVLRRKSFRPNVWLYLMLGMILRCIQSIMAAQIVDFTGGPMYISANVVRAFSFTYLFFSLGASTLRNPIYSMYKGVRDNNIAIKNQKLMAGWLIEQVPSIVVLLNIKGDIVHMNGYAAKSLRMKLVPHRAVGESFFSFFNFVDKDSQRKFEEMVGSTDDLSMDLQLKSYSTKIEVKRDIEWVVRVLRTDLLPTRGSLSTIEDETSLQFICLGKEITDKLQREAALEEARANAETLAKMKDTFVANISHELRTPLNCIIGVTDLFLQTELIESTHSMVVIARTSSNSLLSLINDLLDFAKLSQGQMHIHYTHFSFRDFVENSALALSVMYKDSKLEFGYEISRDCPDTIQSDENRLRQVLHNLLSNAIKFTKKGQVTLHAEKFLQNERGMIRITVVDSGVGMKVEVLKALEERFKSKEIKSGLGIGLVVTNQLLNLMGGELSISSEYHVGTRASLTVPISHSIEPQVLLLSDRPRRPSDLTHSASGASSSSALVTDSVKTISSKNSRRDLVTIQNNRPKIFVLLYNDIIRAITTKTLKGDYDLDATDVPDVETLYEHLKNFPPEMRRNGKKIVSIVIEAPEISKLDVALMDELRTLTTVQIIGVVGGVWENPGQVTIIHKPVQNSVLLRLLCRPHRTITSSSLFGRRSTSNSARQSREVRPSEINLSPVLDDKPETADEIALLEAIPIHILIVEDNKTNQKVMQMMLDRIKNVKYDIADDGSIAVDKYVTKSPDTFDCIFMDFQMPVMDGLQATTEIRRIEKERPEMKRTLIAALTANAQSEEREKGEAVGMDDFITKPIPFSVIQSKIEGLRRGKMREKEG
ncbi:sensory box histidine kinase/response regulator [Planoprotostelium fungivorum]|uniref:Sensory box histidine kinase/response regulator n=1 Tax=Planoprotostelium fungivorum TaxID=1890364 RepID=A0A2P6NPL7_9EUKA|nr:sensory box histidine kinase/response regulator [Planoprotostelium fungivorum]